MIIATQASSKIVVCDSRNVVIIKDAPICFPAKRATRRLRAQSLQSIFAPFSAGKLAFLFRFRRVYFIIGFAILCDFAFRLHSSAPWLEDNFVNLLEGLIAGG